MRESRVLIVDDSAVMRHALTRALDIEPDLEVVGAAKHGREALELVSSLRPDVVTLDVEMPVMDGLETLDVMRVRHPEVPVVMFSTLTDEGAQVAIEAMARGAADYAMKPSGVKDFKHAMQTMRAALVPKIRAIARRGKGGAAHVRPAPKIPVARSGPAVCPAIVAVGVSTGGPHALTELIETLPERLSVPVLIVQHMPPRFTALLAERLDRIGRLKVCEAKDGDVPRAGWIHIAPGGRHMGVVRSGQQSLIRLSNEPQENSCRPAVDYLLRSVAGVYGPRVLAVIMTGMGQDGLLGCNHVRSAGGAVIVQDEESSVVWGMPGLVAQAGLASAIMPVPDLAHEIARRSSHLTAGPKRTPARTGRN